VHWVDEQFFYFKETSKDFFFFFFWLFLLWVIFLWGCQQREELRSFNHFLAYSPRNPHIAHQSRLFVFSFFPPLVPICVCYCMSLSPIRVTASVMIGSDGIQPTNSLLSLRTHKKITNLTRIFFFFFFPQRSSSFPTTNLIPLHCDQSTAFKWRQTKRYNSDVRLIRAQDFFIDVGLASKCVGRSPCLREK
jgi:hypothetical protein